VLLFFSLQQQFASAAFYVFAKITISISYASLYILLFELYPDLQTIKLEETYAAINILFISLKQRGSPP
jgi:hypothetical protein